MAAGERKPPMAAFLAERYWPGLDEATALHAVRQLAAEAGDPSENTAATILSCAFVPEEQTVLVLAAAASRDDVAEMGRRAGLRFDRIVSAVVLPTARTVPSGRAAAIDV